MKDSKVPKFTKPKYGRKFFLEIKNIFKLIILYYLQIIYELRKKQVEMANKPVSVGMAWTCPCFNGESPHWLSMGIGMGNPRFFQLGMGMGNPRFFQLGVWGWEWGCDVYIPVIIPVPAISPYLFKLLKYSQLIK